MLQYPSALNNVKGKATLNSTSIVYMHTLTHCSFHSTELRCHNSHICEDI